MNHQFQATVIFLIGFMGTGKSTVARALGATLDIPVIETDAAIEAAEQRSVADIFSESGETYFRNLETDFLIKLDSVEPLIVSCGGGMILREENRLIMQQKGRVFLLTATAETVLERVRHSDRPLLQNKMSVRSIEAMMNERRPHYEASGGVRVVTDGKKPEWIAEEIISFLNIQED